MQVALSQALRAFEMKDLVFRNVELAMKGLNEDSACLGNSCLESCNVYKYEAKSLVFSPVQAKTLLSDIQVNFHLKSYLKDPPKCVRIKIIPEPTD